MTEFDIEHQENESLLSNLLEVSHLLMKKMPFLDDAPLIYHYTNGSGLQGILEKNCLWATNLFFVNDARELKYGLARCNEVITTLMDLQRENPRYLGILEAIVNEIQNLNTSQIYAICFSKKGDQLSQWRGYASKTTGYSIGFEAWRLTGLCIPPLPEGIDMPRAKDIAIVYDPTIQEELLTQAIDTYVSKYSSRELKPIELKLLGRMALLFLEQLIVGFKDSGFEEEREYRIFVRSDNIDEIKLRERNGVFIPYLELAYVQYSRLPIREIIISPSEDFERIEHGLRLLLEKTGYSDVEIKRSQTPYRTG